MSVRFSCSICGPCGGPEHWSTQTHRAKAERVSRQHVVRTRKTERREKIRRALRQPDEAEWIRLATEAGLVGEIELDRRARRVDAAKRARITIRANRAAKAAA
jgi:hypothetical protein